MLVENKDKERACGFYVSEYHLEMILLPYINNKIKNKENVIIETEKDLRDSIETLMSKVNMSQENKNEILNLKWEKGEEKIKENSNVIVIGEKEYIKKINNEIKDLNVNIVDCYNFEDVKSDINDIINKYDKNLNTLGINNL